MAVGAAKVQQEVKKWQYPKSYDKFRHSLTHVLGSYLPEYQVNICQCLKMILPLTGDDQANADRLFDTYLKRYKCKASESLWYSLCSVISSLPVYEKPLAEIDRIVSAAKSMCPKRKTMAAKAPQFRKLLNSLDVKTKLIIAAGQELAFLDGVNISEFSDAWNDLDTDKIARAALKKMPDDPTVKFLAGAYREAREIRHYDIRKS